MLIPDFLISSDIVSLSILSYVHSKFEDSK